MGRDRISRGYQETPSFAHDPAQVDDGSKTFLGQTGNWGPADIVRIVLDRPEAATFLARKLYRSSSAEAGTPGPELIEPLAAEIKRHRFAIGAGRRDHPAVAAFLFARKPIAAASSRRWNISAGLVRMLEVPRTAINPLALSAGLRRPGPGAVRPAQRRGLGRRPALDQQRHASRANQLVLRRHLGPGRKRSCAFRSDGLGRATTRSILAGSRRRLIDLLLQGDLGKEARRLS